MKRAKNLFSGLSDEVKSEVSKMHKRLSFTGNDVSQSAPGASPHIDESEPEKKTQLKDKSFKIQFRKNSRATKKPNDLFEFRKLILVSDLMLTRGFIQKGSELLRQLLNESHERELIEEQSQILALVDMYNIKVPANNPARKYHKNFIEIVKKYHESVNFYNGFIRKNEKGYEKSFFHRGETLAILKSHYETTNLARIGYFYYFSSLRYHLEGENYSVAAFYGEHLLQLIEKNPKIFSKSIAAKSMVEYIKALINLQDNKKALDRCFHLINLCARHSREEAKCLEFLFILHFHQKDHRILPEIIQRAKKNQYIRENKFYSGKWMMFNATVSFIQRNFEDALRQLKDCCNLPREKTEWVLHTQLLQMMCRIELGQHEWFYYRCEALRKSISRYEVKNHYKLNGRISLIYRLLKSLTKNGQDFHQLIEEENDLLDLLYASEGNFYWNPTGPELLRFEEWIQLKARTQIRRRGRNLVA